MDEIIIKEKMKKSISDFRLPRYDEIANVGLYLEQVVKYINIYLRPLGQVEITASMISNYVKQKLVEAPVKKQYYAEHIARFILIAIMKLVVTLDDIRLMFNIQRMGYEFKMSYDYFCDEFENRLKYAFGLIEVPEKLGTTVSDAKELMDVGISTAVNKIYLDKYISSFREMTEKTAEH
ncbi:MAG: DUF1836 domain-containing protein [Clostridia bacterium]|nr:DUF1836 domain-containing protein [Clostridia bacterium]